MLRKITGRLPDFGTTTEGRAMHGLVFVHTARDSGGVTRITNVKERSNLARVMLLSDPSFNETRVVATERGFGSWEGPGVQAMFDGVAEAVPDTPGASGHVVRLVAAVQTHQ